jgi:hypothetical protein
MHWKKLLSDDKGAVLIGAIVVLVAVTVIGVTLITVSSFETDVAVSEKCKEEARYNSESCAVSGMKVLKMISEYATEEGELGIPEGDFRIPGITYADPETASTKEEEFAKKVYGNIDEGDDPVCDDYSLGLAGTNLDAVGNINRMGASPNEGTAANRQVSGYSYGIGLGGAGGGGMNVFFVIACRGDGCQDSGRNVSYVRYRMVPGIKGGQ